MFNFEKIGGVVESILGFLIKIGIIFVPLVVLFAIIKWSFLFLFF